MQVTQKCMTIIYYVHDFFYAKLRTCLGGNFFFNNKGYLYLYRQYNVTWKTERTIEVPIIWRMCSEYESDRILEVGNVLSHYFKTTHDIVDKYEKGKNVINEDIVDFSSKKRYKLIVSISTLEHVGFDEKVKEPEKFLKAIQNIKKLLDNNGIFVFTIPVGYNLYLDESIRNGRIKIGELYGMKRISNDNRWIEEHWKDTIEKSKYGSPYPFGNGVVIGIIKKDS